jgi:hypothetical protein
MSSRLQVGVAILLAAGLVTVCGEPGPDLSEAQAERVQAWLHCDECVDGELDFLVDSMSQDPELRGLIVDTLRHALREPYDDVTLLENNIGAEWARLEGSAVDSQAFVNRFRENYSATVRKRAAVGMGALGDTVGLREAVQTPGFDSLYRADVRSAISKALQDAGAPAFPGFIPPSPSRLVLRPRSLDLRPGDTATLEAVALDANAMVLRTPMTWATGDSGVATVAPVGPGGGQVVAVDDGATVVWVTADSLSDSTTVEVRSGFSFPVPGLLILSGDAQVDTAGTDLDQPLVVRLTGPGGQPIEGATVTWRVTRGDADPTASASVTDASGRASLSLSLGPTSGPVWIAAEAAGARVVFRLSSYAP